MVTTIAGHLTWSRSIHPTKPTKKTNRANMGKKKVLVNGKTPKGSNVLSKIKQIQITAPNFPK